MRSKPLTRLALSRLRSPSEAVPLGESLNYQEALTLIEQGHLLQITFRRPPSDHFQIRFLWETSDEDLPAQVTVTEGAAGSPLYFVCARCKTSPHEDDCAHQWASLVILWQALTSRTEDLQHPDVQRLCEELQKIPLDDDHSASYSGVSLDSISLALDESALLRGDGLDLLLSTNFSQYYRAEVSRDQSLFAPRLWHLPEVFRKKLSGYSDHSLHEFNSQTRLTEVVRYNFSNGVQLSARDVLRHPLHRHVPAELLPSAHPQKPTFTAWPLLQHGDRTFVSHAVSEVETIMQALLSVIAEHHRQGRLELYLQSTGPQPRALQLSQIEFDATSCLYWRVSFNEKDSLETEFKIIFQGKEDLHFFSSFAVGLETRTLVVHPWRREISLLQENLGKISPNLTLADRKMLQTTVIDEFETKLVLSFLRSRSIPVQLEGESLHLLADRSRTEIHIEEDGTFFIRHRARVEGQKDLVRRGWSSKSELILQVLSKGLGVLLKSDPKTLASRSAAKRDWDLKILKHLGILQYLLTEALSLHFDGHMTDGLEVSRENLFTALQPRLQTLLISGAGSSFVRNTPLTELCSKPVLNALADFIEIIFQSLPSSESYYSAGGEVILDGVVEREFRLIYEMLNRLSLTTGGENYRKSRTPFLSRHSETDFIETKRIDKLSLPRSSGSSGTSVHEAIESFHPLTSQGFQIFYKDQPLQELSEDEFRVDFLLQMDPEKQKYMNWFELNPRFFLRGEEVDPDRLLSLGRGGVVEYEGRLYLVPQKQLPSLRRLEIFWQRLQKGKIDGGKKSAFSKIYQIPRSSTLELLALRASGIKIQGDHEWKRLCAFYDGLNSGQRHPQIPNSVKATLKPYQETGVQWLQDLYELRLGALLADDMGLGKTLQTLTFLDGLRTSGKMGNVLVVVPSSLIFNWQQEIEKFTPDLPTLVFTNREREDIARQLEENSNLLVIVTYGLLMEHEDLLCQYKWNVLIFDEAQNLKNISAKRTSSARSLNAQFKICLTGTPMENHYGEFYSLVDLLVPGSLGKIEDFRRQFVNTEMILKEEMDDLKLKIKPLLLRRTKKEILDQLPDKQETKVSIAFEEDQKAIYRDIALSYNRRVQETMAVQGEASVQLQMLTALLRLRQACSDPAALPEVRYDKVPPKLEALLDSIGEIIESGESALVFTQFLQTLEHTGRLLKAAGIPVFMLHGALPAKQRQKVLADFNSTAGGAVLLMTLKTGGVGLNLTKASYVFHLEPWWNPSVENQATDRAHRLGQSKAVQVFRYIMHESLEEKIELLKERKDRKFQGLFTNSEKETDLGPGTGALSKEDFDFLLGLK